MIEEVILNDIDACDNNTCVVKIDTQQVSDIYKAMSQLVYDDMNKQYKENKISGATYADTYAKLMNSVVSGALNAVVAIQNKETDMDRCIKQSQCDLNKKQEDKLIEDITASEEKTKNETCIANSTCDLNEAKEKAEDIKNGDAADGTSLYGYNKEVLQKQSDLYVRQKTGFDDNARQKLLESQISAWSIAWKDGNAITIPCAVSKAGIDNSVDGVNAKIGIAHDGAGELTPTC